MRRNRCNKRRNTINWKAGVATISAVDGDRTLKKANPIAILAAVKSAGRRNGAVGGSVRNRLIVGFVPKLGINKNGRKTTNFKSDSNVRPTAPGSQE